MNSLNEAKPIIYFSYILIISAIIGIPMSISLQSDPNFDNSFSTFLIILALWNLITGIGILTKKKFGFQVFKIYLYILYIGFPIGTIISKKLFEYIKENNVERFYL